MFFYQVRLALKSIRRNPVLSLVMVLGIGLGIAVSMTFVSAYYIIAGDPIPHKSERLFYVQIDSWNPERPWDDDNPEEPPDQMTYMDSMALMESDIPTYQSAMYKTSMVVHPPTEGARPSHNLMRMCFSDFFNMFDVPFRHGGPWAPELDEGPAAVVVLSDDLNDMLFGGENSVGRKVRIEEQEFEVVGVLDSWHPIPKFYDPHNGSFEETEGAFLPFHWGSEMQIRNSGNTSNWKTYDGSQYEEFLKSEAVWLQYWVQLDDDAQREEYAAFLDAYAMEQRKSGRFERPLNHRLRDVNAWLEFWGVVEPENRAMVIIALLFLLICAVNLVGILLGKFLSRSAEVGVRRALGASRGWVFTQHLIECELIGLAGGAIGLIATLGGMSILERLFGVDFGRTLDGTLLAFGVLLALVAAMIAGLYPAWRICRTAPGIHLKTQ